MHDSEINLLNLIPEKEIQFQESTDGRITLLKPKFNNKFLVKYLIPRMNKPNYKIKLDRFGSFVWKQCNGENTVGQIGELLKEKFQGEIEAVYDRLTVFIQSLSSHKFIKYKNYNP
jgi:hypothetical protein